MDVISVRFGMVSGAFFSVLVCKSGGLCRPNASEIIQYGIPAPDSNKIHASEGKSGRNIHEARE